jgi:hypothetical protein
MSLSNPVYNIEISARFINDSLPALKKKLRFENTNLKTSITDILRSAQVKKCNLL